MINSLYSAYNNAVYEFAESAVGFGCEKISDSIYVGLDESRFPVVLFSVNSEFPDFIPIITRSLSINLFAKCTISFQKKSFVGDFLCLSCTSHDPDLHKVFFRLIESQLILENYSFSIPILMDSIEKLILLFQKLFDPPKNNIVGLFGELLVVNESRDIYGALKSWHSNASDLMDFSWTGGRLEVKTTMSQSRVHEFSLEQLRPVVDLKKFIASVNLQEVHDGLSVLDILDSIISKVKSPELVAKIWGIVFDTLGQGFLQSDSKKFDYQASKRSIKFFDSEDIHSPSFDLPAGVSAVRFTSNLDLVEGLKVNKLGLLKDAGFL